MYEDSPEHRKRARRSKDSKPEQKSAHPPDQKPSEPDEPRPSLTDPHRDEGVELMDFHAHMPTHKYVFAPTGDQWPASSVDARVPPVVQRNARGEPILKENGEPKTTSATAWLDIHRPVEQVTWSPGQPQRIENRLVSDGGWIDRPGCACFNLYRPPQIVPGNANEAGPWLDHVYRVYPADAERIIEWLAHRRQRPHEKINHALVFGGLQGIGKDTILEPVKAAVGPWNFVEAQPAHLFGRFNGFAKAVILRINEGRDLGDADRYGFYDRLKTYTAAPPDVLRVDEKNQREYVVWTVISDLLAPDGTFIHPRAAERTKFCSAHNRPAPEAVTSAHADVEPTGAAAFRAFLRHRSTLVPFLRQPSLHSAARQPAGTGSAQILRSISPKSRRFR